MSLNQVRNGFILELAAKGCSTMDIRLILMKDLGTTISLRQKQRIIKGSGGGRSPESPLNHIQRAIEAELKGPGCLLGYRSMWYRLKHKYDLSVRRDTVMMLLALLDPTGTSQRYTRRLKRRVYRSKGPNFAWHCDGYDKLKPFGLPIHGCIDGFSRRIMWLRVTSSNNNPKFIASFYLQCVRENEGCPSILRTDAGTENSSIAYIQPVLRHNHTDEHAKEKSHRYGKSTTNQRIEALWRHLRVQYTEWWISFFKDMEHEGYFTPQNPSHINAVRYAFGVIIQKELDQFAFEWNHHRIRHSSMAEVPHGVPEVLFHFPSIHGLAEDYKHPTSNRVLSELQQLFAAEATIVCQPYQSLADIVLAHYELQPPTNVQEGLLVYFVLTNSL